MKLKDIAQKATLKQTAKVYESYFNENIRFLEKTTPSMARQMLSKVRGLIQEQRQLSSFHNSEQDPNYLKLVFMEQALVAKIRESVPTAMGATASGGVTTATGQTTPQDQAQAKSAQTAALNKIRDPKLKAAMQKSTGGQALTKDEQAMVANAALASGGISEGGYQPGEATPDMKTKFVNTDITTENRRLYNSLTESEVQQAQVVLAAQDMVDQVQKMLEQVTAMQFKDLPALADQIKNQVGIQEAGQFTTDATAALAGLVENLQGAKQQLEAALGVVTGQEQVIPGEGDAEDMGMGGELDATNPEMDDTADMPPAQDSDEEEDSNSLAASLGRGRR
jgi:hypothetical protein